jgi:diguanylate cyclase (GGDEF)-like protein
MRVDFLPMDPHTVIIVLTTQLLCSGALYHLLGRELPRRSGMDYWAGGALLFGAALAARLFAGPDQTAPWTPALDVLMVLAMLLFLSGLFEFVGRRAIRWYVLVALLIAYALAQAIAMYEAGTPGRFVLGLATLGVLQLLLAATAISARSGQTPPLRPPLLAMALLTGLLGVATLARAAHVLGQGVDEMYVGVPAQLYFGYVSLATVMLALLVVWLAFVRLSRQLAELASRDALTRLFNRNGLDDILKRHFSAREPAPMTLLQVDIDHFKAINDVHGHAIGDAVLRAVGDTLASRVRGNDFVARISGEEFLVGCVGGDMGVALALGKRLREGVSALRVTASDGLTQVSCTVSVGVSRSFRSLSEWEEAVREADRALFTAKAGGRNCVVAFEQMRA